MRLMTLTVKLHALTVWLQEQTLWLRGGTVRLQALTVRLMAQRVWFLRRIKRERARMHLARVSQADRGMTFGDTNPPS